MSPQSETYGSTSTASAAMCAGFYSKHFIPLESNPHVFTQLIHSLGVSSRLSFQDVWTLDKADLPFPVLALIFIFPTSKAYEIQKAREEATCEEYMGSTEEEDVVWFKQTINNACGLYAILHAICNGDAREFILPESLLANLLEACLPLGPPERALVLERSKELESAYAAAAKQGDSAVPANAEDEVDYHFICFAKSNKNSHIYELDGDRKGPMDKGVIGTEVDALSESALRIVRELIERDEDESTGFSLMALVHT